MKKRRQLVIATAAAVVVLAGGGYLGMASYRSATAPVATSEQKEFLTVNKTSMALKNGKADLVINVDAHTAVKVTADGNVMDPVEWPATDSSQSYMLALTSNGTYYVEATNGGKTKKIKVVVGEMVSQPKRSLQQSLHRVSQRQKFQVSQLHLRLSQAKLWRTLRSQWQRRHHTRHHLPVVTTMCQVHQVLVVALVMKRLILVGQIMIKGTNQVVALVDQKIQDNLSHHHLVMTLSKLGTNK